MMTTHSHTLMAVSMGAVFMGAVTYIGNAPNLMSVSIVRERGVKMPSFSAICFGRSVFSSDVLHRRHHFPLIDRTAGPMLWEAFNETKSGIR